MEHKRFQQHQTGSCEGPIVYPNASSTTTEFWRNISVTKHKKHVDQSADADMTDFSTRMPNTLQSHAIPGSTTASSVPSLHRVSSAESESSSTSLRTTESTSKRSYDSKLNDENLSNPIKSKKRVKVAPNTDEQTKRLFACPYAKFDVARYSMRNVSEPYYRGCSTCFLRDIPRLKQHLQRVHKRPDHYCSCCYDVFDTWPDLQEHVRRRDCNLVQCPYPEKMTMEQLSSIKRRYPKMDQVECWYNIYRIIFPGIKLPKTPFADFPVLASAELIIEYLRREGPLQISKFIWEIIQQYLPPDTDIETMLTKPIEGCISSLIQHAQDVQEQDNVAIDMDTSSDIDKYQVATSPPKATSAEGVTHVMSSERTLGLRRPTTARTQTQETNCSTLTIRPSRRSIEVDASEEDSAKSQFTNGNMQGLQTMASSFQQPEKSYGEPEQTLHHYWTACYGDPDQQVTNNKIDFFTYPHFLSEPESQQQFSANEDIENWVDNSFDAHNSGY